MVTVIVVLILLIFQFKNCKSETFTAPEITNVLPTQEPIYITPEAVTETKWKDSVIYTQNPVNEKLAEKYKAAKDSLEKYKLYLNAIQIRQFKNTFEDENVAITLEGSVQGEIKEFKPSYTIKPRTFTQKTTVFRMLIGGEVRASYPLDLVNFGANLGFQNKRGNILRFGYSRINGQDYATVGYDVSVFRVRR